MAQYLLPNGGVFTVRGKGQELTLPNGGVLLDSGTPDEIGDVVGYVTTNYLLNPRIDNPVNMIQPVNLFHPLNRGLVAWYLVLPELMGGAKWMNLCAGFDIVSYGTLTLMDPATNWLGARGRPGGKGCLNFDGTNDAVFIEKDFISLNYDNYTYTAWIQTVQTSIGVCIHRTATINDGSVIQFGINFITTGKLGADDFETSGGVQESVASVNDGLWHHVALVRGTGTRTFYIDGILDVLRTSTETFIPTSTPTRTIFGKDKRSDGGSDTFRPFNGRMDDIRIYNRQLSASEVYGVYQASRQNNVGTLNRINLQTWFEEAEEALVQAGFSPIMIHKLLSGGNMTLIQQALRIGGYL